MPFVYGKRAGNGVSDVAKSEMVVLFGDNSCETKMSGGGPTYHYMKGLETSGAKVVVIDPRYTESVAAPAAQPVASIVMTRQSAISLRNLLIQTLGVE